MRIPVEWGGDNPDVIFFPGYATLDERLLDYLRTCEEKCDCSGAALCMAFIESDMCYILGKGYIPNTCVTTFGIASALQGLYMEILSAKSVGCEGKIYNKLMFITPVPYEMVVIPSQKVKAGELFIFDRDHIIESGSTAYRHNLYNG